MQLFESIWGSSSPSKSAEGCRAPGRQLRELALEYRWSEVLDSSGGFGRQHRLGEGAYGAVYRGTLQEGISVAVKVIDEPVSGGFKEEVKLLSRVHHPNVVLLLGFAREPRDAAAARAGPDGVGVPRRALVYELLSGGDAYERLRGCDHFPWGERLRTAVDVSRGLAHLHRHRPEIFHRDIKTQNILFSSDGTAKIADFGLACVSKLRKSRELAVECTAGTPGYVDPLYASSGIVKEANEVYSMGMVLIELLTRMPPALLRADGSCAYLVDDLQPQRDGVKGRILQRLDARARWPLHTAAALITLALLCIHSDDERRPSFQDLASIVQELAITSCEAEASQCSRRPAGSARRASSWDGTVRGPRERRGTMLPGAWPDNQTLGSVFGQVETHALSLANALAAGDAESAAQAVSKLAIYHVPLRLRSNATDCSPARVVLQRTAVKRQTCVSPACESFVEGPALSAMPAPDLEAHPEANAELCESVVVAELSKDTSPIAAGHISELTVFPPEATLVKESAAAEQRCALPEPGVDEAEAANLAEAAKADLAAASLMIPLPANRSPYPTGTRVEYYSTTHGNWIPAFVQGFDFLSGTYQLNVQPLALPHKVRVAPPLKVVN